MEPTGQAALTHSRTNHFIALGVFLSSLSAYLVTVAPTVCFWDCGEYVAAGHSLGIPHPPGNPLFIMIARVVSMALFFFKDVGYRLNLIASFSSAFMAMLIYLIIVRAFVGWMGVPDAAWKRIVVYIAGLVGALFAAFGSTVWFCSVESEVNSAQLVPITLCTWLVLVWAQSTNQHRDRILVLITYIAYLGIGIHMYSMITLGPLFLYVILIDPSKRTDWRLWMAGALMGLVIYDISWFFWAGGGVVLGSLFMSFTKGKNRPRWRLCFFIALFGMLGFSTHLYIPVRSSVNPAIDENHPATYAAFQGYLQRKQYGSESMISRMFWRRGTWSHQFGIEGNMGFGGFFITQFFHLSLLDTQRSLFADGQAAGWMKCAVYSVPVIMVLFGMWFLYKRKREVAVLLGTLLLMTTVVLVLYMNFSDGTRCEKRDYRAWVKAGRRGPEPLVQREVRVRDYFFVGGFMFYSMWMGIAAGGLLYLLYTNRRRFLRVTVGPMATVLFAASPALPFTQNMGVQTRRGDFIPFDYAYNLLMSCEKDAILITNGDNDTFPLWAMQEGYGIRRDVRVVNLSLSNTKWFIKQLKYRDPKVPIALNDDQIERLDHTLNPIVEPTRISLQRTGITINLPTRKQLTALRIQDQLVLNIVDANRWQRPIYFAVTVSDENYMGLAPYLQMQGLVFRIMPYEVADRDKINVGRTVFLFDHVFRFRGISDGTSTMNETSEKLLSNYAATYTQIAFALRKPLGAMKQEIARMAAAKAVYATGDSLARFEKVSKAYHDTLALVIRKLDQCITMVPWNWRLWAIRHDVLIANDRAAEAEKKIRGALTIEPANKEFLRMLAQSLELQGKKQQAAEVLSTLVGSQNDAWESCATLAQGCIDAGNLDSAISIVQQFARMYPLEQQAVKALELLSRAKNERDFKGKTAEK